MEAVALFFLPIVMICVLAEIVWSRRHGRPVYNLKESLSNLGIMIVNRSLKPITFAWAVFVLSLFEPMQVYQLPDTGWAFLLTFLVADFAYYWYHRFSHEVPFLWTMHHTHHSSPWMNFTTAMRLNWVAKFVSPLFFIPLVLFGFSATYLGVSLALGLLFQFFLHTESIGRLGWFEGKLLNTPSAHRVHHGSNLQYIDKNYGGVFIFWDRLFGTYAPEEEMVQYGVTTGFIGHNPLAVQFRPLFDYMRGQGRLQKQVSATVALLAFVGWSAQAQGALPNAAAFSGAWQYAGTVEEKKARQQAIVEASKDMPGFMRSMAQSRLEERTTPSQKMVLDVEGDRFVISRDDRTISLRRGDKPTVVEKDGKRAMVSVRSEGERIVVSSQMEKAKVVRTYTLSPDRKHLTMSVRMMSERFSAPLVYKLTYRRE